MMQVHREQHRYRESSEAASRAMKIAPTNPSALLCSALTSLLMDTKRTEEQRVQFAWDVLNKLNNIDTANTNKVCLRRSQRSNLAFS